MNNLKLTLKAWLPIFLIAVALCALTGWLADLIGVHLVSQPTLDLVRNAHGLKLVKLLTLVLIVAPILEELIFRLLLFRLPSMLSKWLGGAIFCGIVAATSAAIFVSAHYVEISTLGKVYFRPLDDSFIALYFFGLAQCWLYRKANAIWAPMLNHFLFNLSNILILFLLPQ